MYHEGEGPGLWRSKRDRKVSERNERGKKKIGKGLGASWPRRRGKKGVKGDWRASCVEDGGRERGHHQQSWGSGRDTEHSDIEFNSTA